MNQKRFYQVGEEVFVIAEKQLGEIERLHIKPDKKIFKADVVLKDGNKGTYNLWEIDKHIKKKEIERPFDKAFNVAKKRIDNDATLDENFNRIGDALEKISFAKEKDEVLNELGNILYDAVECFVLLEEKPNDYFEKSGVNKMVEKGKSE